MLRYTCYACQNGEHKFCQGKEPPPPGVIGGKECDCDGNCVPPATPTPDPQIDAAMKALHGQDALDALAGMDGITWGEMRTGFCWTLNEREAKLCADALRAAAGVHDDEAWALAKRLDPAGEYKGGHYFHFDHDDGGYHATCSPCEWRGEGKRSESAARRDWDRRHRGGA